MAASLQDISDWFDQGAEDGATHMIVVCDCFDYDDYPAFVSKGEDLTERMSQYDGKNMQRIMEVYNLSKDKEQQMKQAATLLGDDMKDWQMALTIWSYAIVVMFALTALVFIAPHGELIFMIGPLLTAGFFVVRDANRALRAFANTFRS